ncbi:methionyl-tRNA formyltransferase [Aureimonas sp. Leaf454]|uniref:methionyl-tRNA formyltransferase n=1 Tax=Aureimonas sp. Leaf454 TaxID=1736381 RepID=UPI0006F24140|nr:methionyl-tRNA formyltransferase [Aureimonas sp. Leaf454]KQT44462.1 methionyl-tRNA formyltransferase [Aureimonas sp. Leaf454]
MRIVFMGTPAYAVPTLRALAEAGHDIAAVYSQPPRAAGRRGLQSTPSPVQAEAERLGRPVRTPLSLKGVAEIADLAALEADVAVVVAYGLLLPQAALDAPRLFCLNGHASLLPRWRGAAPIQRAIEAGDPETGVMIMRMEAGLDTGPVAATRTVEIAPNETSGELHDRLSRLTAEAMIAVLDDVSVGSLDFEPQEAITARTGRETVYARKIEKAEAELDFALPADTIARRINAFSPFPGAWTLIDFGPGPERVKLLRAERVEDASGAEPGTVLDDRLLVACGRGAVRILDLQRAGGRPLSAQALLRGVPLPPGARIGRR